jgi:glyceraldehyde 3-phosphate dehydrogenase
MPQNEYEHQLQTWIDQKKSALELSLVASKLSYDKAVELVLFRRKLVDRTVPQILNDHLYADTYVNLPITPELSLQLATSISKLDIAPSRIDLGKLAKGWFEEGEKFPSIDDFIAKKLEKHIGQDKLQLHPKDVVLYGFGRIGRLAARMLLEETGSQLRLKAIVIRMKNKEEIIKRASLLRKDSIHGKMSGPVEYDVENSNLIVNGHTVKILSGNPGEIDYTQYGINDALLIDNTGAYTTEEQLNEHLKSKGISKVLLTAPAKGNVPNVVYGVNHTTLDLANTHVFSAASCTTNAIVPVLKVINDNLGIDNGHIETVHAYTNDQNLVDNFHKKSRRGRSAPMNMVITETGAAKAAVKAMPELKGKLTANAVRVPIPNVSLAILSLRLNKTTSLEEVNELMRKGSLEGGLMEQIDYSLSSELVSTDVIGNTHALEFDSKATIVSEDGKSVTLYAWYDNEYGYTCQVMRLAKYIAGVIRLTYY